VKVQSFEERHPEAIEAFKPFWFDYMKYCYEMESGERVDSAAQKRAVNSLLELARDVKGFPLLPSVEGDEGLPFMKQMIRSFVTAHYREYSNSTFFCFLFC